MLTLLNRAALAAVGTADQAMHARRLQAVVAGFSSDFRHADLARQPGQRGEAPKTSVLNVAVCGIGNLAPAVAALVGREGGAPKTVGGAAVATTSRDVLRRMLRWLLDSARESMTGFNRANSLAMTLGAASAIVWELRVAAAAAVRRGATGAAAKGVTDGEQAELSAVSQHLSWSFATGSATYRGSPAGRRNSQIPIARALRRFLACTAPLPAPLPAGPRVGEGGVAAAPAVMPAHVAVVSAAAGKLGAQGDGAMLRAAVATLVPALFERTLGRLLDAGELILFTVTFCANPANDLTCSPSSMII